MKTIACLSVLCLALVSAAEAIAQAETEKTPLHITGSVETKWALLGNEVLEAADTLNSDAPPSKEIGQGFAFGRLNLRVHAGLAEGVSALAELETKTVDLALGPFGGLYRLGEDELRVFFEQAYVKVDNIFVAGCSLRLGIGDLTYKLRPGGEPFVLDIQESESFFGGFFGYDPTADDPQIEAQIRNTLVRDTLETAGILLSCKPEEMPYTLDLFAMTTLERGPVSLDESIYGLYSEIKPSENLVVKVLASLVSGGNDVFLAPALNSAKKQDVWLIGIGLDYLLFVKEGEPSLELFGEWYTNFGKLYEDESVAALEKVKKKKAYAYNFGIRYARPEGLWLEASLWKLTGDKNPYDKVDSGFQSYENVNQFLILEDKEAGLDLDTNYRAIKASLGKSAWEIVADCKIDARLDVGVFSFDRRVYNFNGDARLGINDLKLGTEIDLSIDHKYSQNLSFFLKLAYLFGSNAFEKLTYDKRDSASAVVFGTKVSF